LEPAKNGLLDFDSKYDQIILEEICKKRPKIIEKISQIPKKTHKNNHNFLLEKAAGKNFCQEKLFPRKYLFSNQ